MALTRVPVAVGDVDNIEDRLDVIEGTSDRLLAVGGGEMVGPERGAAFTLQVTLVTRRPYLHYFWAQRTETCNNIEFWSGTTVAAATPTLCRIGIYQINQATQAGTLVSSIANDTTLFSVANTNYVRAFTAPFSKVNGVQYAMCMLVVSTFAMPSAYQCNTGPSAQADAAFNRNPKVAASLAVQNDLPASFATVAASRFAPTARVF